MEMENYGISKAYFATLERVNQKVKAFHILFLYILINLLVEELSYIICGEILI